MNEQGFVAQWRGHLRHAGEGYFQHMAVAGRIGGLMIAAGCACLLHALLPALCTDRASRTVRRLHDQIERRSKPAETPAQHWALEFEI